MDWKRGLVRINGRGKQLLLSREFFTELRWWRENIEQRCAIPLIRPPRPADAVITGTDASDLGCGAVAWLAGQREEVQHLFNAFEKQQPINFRELVGATRIIEHWGPRLAGRQVIVETDNMATMWCIKRRRARTEYMAEQLRRLYAVAARWNIDVRVMHTRGIDLIQPDAISRGHAPAPPRQRLKRRVFEELRALWGPFDEGIGAALEHSKVTTLSSRGDGWKTVWLHPAYHTVAATLRHITTELRQAALGSEKGRLSGLVMLPEWEAAR